MTLLAKNAAGWARLRRIMSATQLPDRVPTTSRDTLNTLAGEDLVMLLEPASAHWTTPLSPDSSLTYR
ncbi:hypothetical protein [Streptomyces gardneri]|uniref:hypothetical protein n=1 Tax=Streptomyces gardneri TaxID=66892 RepID=UPI0035DE5166